MRNDPTTPEAVLWSDLRASQTGYKFRRQSVIGSYIVDFERSRFYEATDPWVRISTPIPDK